MNINEIRNAYGSARISDRQVSELIGLAHGLIADGVVTQAEAEYLHKWLAANQHATENPLISELYLRVEDYFADGVLDDDEAGELLDTLKSITGGDFELGEVLKSSTLPLCDPAPKINFDDNRFCFAGTFCYGKRKDCEAAAKELGATVGGLSGKTNYLVVGIYATDSWVHSSFGRKIEKAVGMREDGYPIRIISEEHWLKSMKKENHNE